MRATRLSTILLTSILFAACASAPSAPPSPQERAPLEISAEASVRAAELHEQGIALEPQLTALLQLGAERRDLWLYGLNYRIKSRASLERKIQTGMLNEGLTADQLEISDVLRYTMVIHDQPPGAHNHEVADVLKRADELGYPVREVKNYWPAGDTYSGVNAVLETPEGFLWELQFHTVGSLAAKDEGHHLYETFRLPGTPVEKKREIFDQLVERWNWVQIPEGILVEGSLHSTEKIILRDRP